MSTTIHDVVIVQISGYVLSETWTQSPSPDLDVFRAKMPGWLRPCVIGPFQNPLNNTYTAFWMPDGSNEGWADSDESDSWRHKFLDLFSFAFDDGSSPYQVMCIRYGPDMRGQRQRPILTEPFACYCPGDPSHPDQGHKPECPQHDR